MNARGIALPIALWAVVILAALSTTAFVTALLDLRLASQHRDHAAALHIAEAGLAMALSAITEDPIRRTMSDSVSGAFAGGLYRAAWEPRASGLRIVSRGVNGSATREVEAWVPSDASDGSRISAWREVRS